jgi:hypothetical protein
MVAAPPRDRPGGGVAGLWHKEFGLLVHARRWEFTDPDGD